ncbi:hypothetical protein RFI_07041 [Reticulomyxa filosa]|uniref:Uncharacterized protein n=1 Tax=Reticulomyxa filosa TaxID=46433 RepID=X6NXS6_RETFI|nr:hypothetical protein RFI_07041 [Reticulomyxa filosa]|eukprot:ETO30082.1 hypothetical protein RFI_07041 [Reticulomyxa filosa]
MLSWSFFVFLVMVSVSIFQVCKLIVQHVPKQFLSHPLLGLRQMSRYNNLKLYGQTGHEHKGVYYAITQTLKQRESSAQLSNRNSEEKTSEGKGTLERLDQIIRSLDYYSQHCEVLPLLGTVKSQKIEAILHNLIQEKQKRLQMYSNKKVQINILDVGCYIGYTTLRMAKVLSQYSHSIESK